MTKRLCFLTTAQGLVATEEGQLFFVIGTDEFMRGYRDEMAHPSLWASKSPDEVYSDMAALADRWRNAHPEITAHWMQDEDEFPFYGQSGPPLRIPIPHRVSQFESAETPRAIAKARAVAIFGPKRGRWK